MEDKQKSWSSLSRNTEGLVYYDKNKNHLKITKCEQKKIYIYIKIQYNLYTQIKVSKKRLKVQYVKIIKTNKGQYFSH